MIEIRFSDGTYGKEVDLSGLPAELRKIEQLIIELVESEQEEVCIIQAGRADPSPYDYCLSSLLIRKTATLIKVSVIGESLQVEGEMEKLRIFADWFSFEDDTWSGYHRHFDSLGNEKWVDVRSQELVISVRNSIKRELPT
jgi:hypothetical protein